MMPRTSHTCSGSLTATTLGSPCLALNLPPFAHSNAGMHTTASAPRAITCTRVKDQACTVTSLDLLSSRLRQSTICEIQEPRTSPPRRTDDDTAHGADHNTLISSLRTHAYSMHGDNRGGCGSLS